ncbi:NADH-quinone oxidoreductase subunit NuoE, partial [Paracoccaceae bacterium]|nr:NADH-quinone oxidoreductase subunit NuoE [Paracoccaceae bacterium]
MLRRLYPDQPDSFAFSPENQKWAEAQLSKYPQGREASAIIPLLWRAQEQEGWLSRPAVEFVADMLNMAHIRALEVATFYFMFQLRPVGSAAHVQVCGTLSCMICGAEDLIDICKEKISPTPHTISNDGKLSWEEVECLGACTNAPMAQIGKDYYEDLSNERFEELIEEWRNGSAPSPGPQNGRFSVEPSVGLTSLLEGKGSGPSENKSVSLAKKFNDTIKKIDGTEVKVSVHWNK